jgi:hypothetical protein
MANNFLNTSSENKVNPKFIILLIIVVFSIVGGLFAFDRWWGYKVTLPTGEQRAIQIGKETFEVKSFDTPVWEGKER